MTLVIRMLPEAIQALQRELRNHPELWNELNTCTTTFEDIIATLAARFDIVMHGEYLEPEVCQLCTILVQKLQDKRKVIITDPAKVIELIANGPELKHF
jgi:hypothetical protein